MESWLSQNWYELRPLLGRMSLEDQKEMGRFVFKTHLEILRKERLFRTWRRAFFALAFLSGVHFILTLSLLWM